MHRVCRKGSKYLHRMYNYIFTEWAKNRNNVKGNNNMKAYFSVHSASSSFSWVVAKLSDLDSVIYPASTTVVNK